MISTTPKTTIVPPPTIRFRTRRRLAIVFTLLMTLLYLAISSVQQARLADTRWLSGFTLLACLLGLTMLGARRRLPVLPLGRVSIWTQIHLYMGLFAIVVYAMHVPAILAGGVLEFWLSVAFLTVSVSGIYGVFASRSIPKKLTAVEGQHRFDQVAWHRKQILAAAVDAIEALPVTPSGKLVRQHFESELAPYFSRRAPLRYMAWPGGRRRRMLLEGIGSLGRYVDGETATAIGQLSALIRQRDDLDYQFALQLRLRSWVAFHCVTSIALISLAVVHTVFAIRFTR